MGITTNPQKAFWPCTRIIFNPENGLACVTSLRCALAHVNLSDYWGRKFQTWSFKIKINKQENRTVQPEYKSSKQNIVLISIHLNPYPSAPPYFVSTMKPMDPYGRNTRDGVIPTTNMIQFHTQGPSVQCITLWCYRPCHKPTPEQTDPCYWNIVRSKISDIITTRIQPLWREFPLQGYESWSSQEYLYFSQSHN